MMPLKRCSLLVRLAIVLLGASTGACGTTSQNTRSVSGVLSARAHPIGDEDRDNQGQTAYLDGDDGSVRYFGHAASARDTRAITTLVRRYYAAAAAGDGVGACALIFYIVTETIPEEYGRAPGPLYLRGATSCQAVLSRVFKHFHARLTAPLTVTAVRVNGDRADAMLSWTTLPAGFIETRREGGGWKVNSPLATPLP
jgi:hypothetical protein